MLNKEQTKMKEERKQLSKPNFPINKNTTKVFKINKILDTSKYKILSCLYTTTQTPPKNYVPGCHRIIRKGDSFQNVNISVKEEEVEDDDSFIICNIGQGKKAKIKENSKGNTSLWHIALNHSLSEPLVSVYVNDQPVIVLIDTGSEVNCISYRLIELLELQNEIKKTQVKCAGPNGEMLKTHGEMYMDFQLGSRTYNAKFIIVQLAERTAGIIGYNFMKQNNISIYCGRALTNDDNYLPDEEENITDYEYFKVKPNRDYEINQNSVRNINLHIPEIPQSHLSQFLMTPFLVFKKDLQPQTIVLDHKAQFEYPIENNSNISYTEERCDTDWGYAVPISKLLVNQETKNINKIYPQRPH